MLDREDTPRAERPSPISATGVTRGEGVPTPPEGDAYHVPVMLSQVLEVLVPVGDGILVDGTAGGGGHAEALLRQCPEAHLVAVDRDPEAIAALSRRLAPFGDRVRLLHERFDHAAKRLLDEGTSVAGVLLDLGISSRQIDADARGFTFRDDAPLDARMDAPFDGSARPDTPTAADLLNSLDEAELTRLFRRLAEEPRARPLARAIVAERGEAPLQRAGDLNRILDRVLRKPVRSKDRARIYQALRIQVNAELEALEAALPLYREALRPGGILVVLSYHSLEDREVKHAFREWSRRCVCPPELPLCQCRGEPLGTTLTRSVVRPSEAEVEANPRARSARFRAWRKAA